MVHKELFNLFQHLNYLFKSYKKALELNPNNEFAKDKI